MSTPQTENNSSHDGRAAEQDPGGLSAVSNAMVRLYKDQFGRGPTKVRSHYAGPDALVCLLEHTFTPAEKNLQAMGEHQRLRDTRTFFQYASAGEFVSSVEQATGRKVRSFISGICTNTDVAAELFVLEPKDSEGVLLR
ncbi:MAG TPA: Na-translocating system protein MpsC family protein [Solirubrobacteraceae bacterium]|jgi:uncharacterized protein YbcI|nr:Na-translocating system protein MpsC family protein [Solirubrobacteraceae bacterium]